MICWNMILPKMPVASEGQAWNFLKETNVFWSLLVGLKHHLMRINDWCIFVANLANQTWQFHPTKPPNFCFSFWYTLPETNCLHLKMVDWKTILSSWGPAHYQVRTVSFRECNTFTWGVYCICIYPYYPYILYPPFSSIFRGTRESPNL